MKRVLFGVVIAAVAVMATAACDQVKQTPTTPSASSPVPLDPLAQAGVTVPAQYHVGPNNWAFSTCPSGCGGQVIHATDARNGSPISGAVIYVIWDLANFGMAGGQTDASGNLTLNIPASATVWVLANAFNFTSSPITVYCPISDHTYSLNAGGVTTMPFSVCSGG